jgi:DNA recombination protein RmuC
MVGIVIICLLVAALGVAGGVVLAGVVAARRSAESEAVAAGTVAEAVERALVELRTQATAERDAAVQAALQHAAVLQREQLGAAAVHVQSQVRADLDARKDVIDSRLDQVQHELRAELARLGQAVQALGAASAEKFGAVERSLTSHAEITQTLAECARSLREALASPSARGQWGERMAEDVLRLAGFVENVNYVKQTQLDGASGRPDFTFPLPKGHELYMDVKFPMAAYLRYLEAGSEAEREAHRGAFLRDVRLRVRELARRDYARASAHAAVDYVLLFLPNEQLAGFIHEQDPALIDEALGQRVVMCSPLTLFAFLGVIRQAFDNFMIEQTSDEILGLIGKFDVQWGKYAEAVEKVKRQFDTVHRSFDELTTTRRRQLEKPLHELQSLRRERGLPIDGELFGGVDDLDDVDDGGSGGNVRALGA